MGAWNKHCCSANRAVDVMYVSERYDFVQIVGQHTHTHTHTHAHVRARARICPCPSLQVLINDILVAAIMLLSKSPTPNAMISMMHNGHSRPEHGFCVSRYTINSILEEYPTAGDLVQDMLLEYRRWLCQATIQEREERRANDAEHPILCSADAAAGNEPSMGEEESDDRDKGRKLSRMCCVM